MKGLRIVNDRWSGTWAVSPGGRVAWALVGLALGALAASGAANAAMYKWVDDKGVVHYSDKMPPDAVNKGNVELNKQGMQVRKVAPAMPDEKRHALEAEQARQLDQQREAARQQQEAARRDRALLDSYTTEGDIDLAKSRAIRTLQASVDSAQAYSAQLTKRKAGLLERKRTADVEREIAGIDENLARQTALIAEKKRQLVEVAARYDADKARWRAIKSGATVPGEPPTTASASGAPSPASTSKR